jgi:hypothetical protein
MFSLACVVFDDPDAAVAQLVRASDCGSEGRWFESTQLYQTVAPVAAAA